MLISGPVCSGKSSLVGQLQAEHSATVVKTKDLILRMSPRTKPERRRLQLAGQRLDKADGGAWVARIIHAVSDFGLADVA